MGRLIGPEFEQQLSLREASKPQIASNPELERIMPTQQKNLVPKLARAATLLQRFRTVRAATMNFSAPLTPEDMMVQSCAEASPVKWHLAHTSWFFETFVLAEYVAGYKPFDPDFKWLFNSYYRALGEMPEKKLRASFSRPPLDQILAYRCHVDAAICSLLEHTPEDESLRTIALGLEHEQQHLELAATDIKHAFFTNPLHPAYAAPATIAPSDLVAPPLEWLSFTPSTAEQPGVVDVGISPDPSDLETFAFDNETPRHPVYIAPFRLASRPVTCAEYLGFIEASGYTRPELWLSEGWDTVESEAWQAPLYWRRDPANPSGWSIFTLHGWQSLGDLSETPVCHLSLFEADAFARWSGHRLPTEFEWEFVAAQHPPTGNFLESGNLHPRTGSPVADTPQQLFGDVWEWTQSPYTGYPGYKPLPGALGEYNGKFMSSQIILRGGSCVTPESHIRATYRNFFGPATRWQFSGLRLARDGA
jgi:ergothioneine biosynthesis protein EgtB